MKTLLTRPACKGQRWITLKDQSFFRIGETFTVKVAGIIGPCRIVATRLSTKGNSRRTSSIENGFDHRTVKTSTFKNLVSLEGVLPACLKTKVILPRELQTECVVMGLHEQHCKFLSLQDRGNSR